MDYMTDLRKFPQQKSINLVNKLNVKTIILHHQDIYKLNQLDPFTLTLNQMIPILNQQSNFTLAYQDDQTTVFTLSKTAKPQALP